jgi:hypothetical protein
MTSNLASIKRDPKNEVQLHRWLTGYWSRSGNALPFKLELRQVVAHGEGQRVTHWTQEDFKGKSPHEIADMIIETANDDALNASESGTVRYAVLGYRSEKQDYDGRCYLKISVKNDDFDASDREDSPDWKGQYGQILRHNEQLVKISIGAFGQVLSSMERRAARDAEIIDKLSGRHIEVLNTLDALSDRKDEKEIKLKKEAHDLKMQEELIKSLPKYLSVIANKMLGGGNGATPVATEPLKNDMVRRLMRSIYDSPEQDKQAKISSVFAAFSKEEIAMFVELWESYETEFKKEDEAKSNGTG